MIEDPLDLASLVDDKLDLSLIKPNDLKGRRVINAGKSKNLQDYITHAELLSAFPNWNGHV